MKRSTNDIIFMILGTCQGGASKTRIVYQAKLNFRTVNPYLDLLIKNELLEVRQSGIAPYITSEKGAKILETMKCEAD